jgi:hypothetical protein
LEPVQCRRHRDRKTIIVRFVSAYEKGSWKDAMLAFPDEQRDGGVDGLAARADGRLTVSRLAAAD